MDARHPDSWHRGAFPSDGLNGLSKIEYAAIHIFAAALTNMIKLFGNPDVSEVEDQIKSEVADIAISSWTFARQLHEEGLAMKAEEI
ncbi:MAG: hypothetical protein EBT26_01850 [Microbacteriaceae bacterium]|nr:hypothetical protein [Microbacteriaceae bacterium]